MPVPYHRAPRVVTEGCAAFLDVVYRRPLTRLYGGLLVLDGRGEPLEFVHTSADAPSGFLWPEARVIESATVAIAHSLFDGCRKEPDVLICRSTLGAPEFCRSELAPGIPFLQVPASMSGAPIWLNDAPTPGMRAAALFQSLLERSLMEEPFVRLLAGLREAYPEIPEPEGHRDSANR